MAGWSDFIQTGSYAGIAFDFVSTQDEHSRVFDRQQIPNRDGVFLEDRAADGRTTDVLAIFVEDDYPDVMNQLIAAIDAGGVREFVHPIWGKTKALITRASAAHNADESIDSATMQLHVEEHTESAQGPRATRTSIAAKAGALRDGVLAVFNAITIFAAAVDALEAAGTTLSGAQQAVVDQAIADGTAAANLSADAANAFEQSADTMSADEVQAQTNGALTKCDAVSQGLSSFTTAAAPLPEQYDFAQAVVELAAQVSDLARTAAAGKPALTTYTVEADTTLLAWCHAKYGDSSRAGEVLALNSWISDPLLLPRGSEVTAYAA